MLYFYFLLSIWVLGVIGWVLNIISIAQSTFDGGGMLILRVIGAFIAPLGAILGYF